MFAKFSHLSLTLNCEMQQSRTVLRINTVTSGGTVLLSIHVAIRYILCLPPNISFQYVV